MHEVTSDEQEMSLGLWVLSFNEKSTFRTDLSKEKLL